MTDLDFVQPNEDISEDKKNKIKSASENLDRIEEKIAPFSDEELESQSLPKESLWDSSENVRVPA